MKIQHTFLKLGISLILTISAIISTNVSASSDPNPDSNYPVQVSASPTSVQADGVSTSTVKLFIFGYGCPDETNPSENAQCADGSTSTTKIPLGNRWIGIYSYDTGLIFSGTTLEAGVRYTTSDTNGQASFQLSSTASGSKTLQFSDHVKGTPPRSAATQEVIFTPYQVANNSNNAPSAPILTQVTVDGNALDRTQLISIKSTQVIVLNGTTIPNGKVLLSINTSDAETKTVFANNTGDWSYKFTQLQEGNYTVMGTATDPTNNQSSPEVLIVSFSVAVPTKVAAAANKNTKSVDSKASGVNWIYIAIASFIVALLLAVTVFLIIRSRRTKADQAIASAKTIESEVVVNDKDKLE